MSGKNKNRETLLSDFLRYKRDEMSEKERNSFERELQKDPFANEAEEGFTAVSPEQSLNDLEDLQKRLKKRTAHKHKLVIYRVAASVAVLMLISSVFLIIYRNKTGNQVSESANKNEPLEIKESLPVIEALAKNEIPKKPPQREQIKDGLSTGKNINTVAGKGAVATENKVADEIGKIDSNTDINVKAEEELTVADQRSEPVAVMAKEKYSKLVGGVTAKKANDDREVIHTGYLAPRPVNGKEDFDRYIEDNIRRPDTVSTDQEEVVLNFIVHTDGSIDSIKVVKSPGKLYSDEAERLIKSGPAWKPAEEKGNPVEDRVNVSIVFK
jgi:hypothetical protein